MRVATEIGTSLEGLVSELVRRRWAARAALVSEQGEVLALCAAPRATTGGERAASAAHAPIETPPVPDNDAGDDEDDEGASAAAPADRDPGPRPAGERTARLLIESLDEARWLYLDLGSTRLVARLSRASYAGAATNWLINELRRLGVTVEREPVARD